MTEIKRVNSNFLVLKAILKLFENLLEILQKFHKQVLQCLSKISFQIL